MATLTSASGSSIPRLLARQGSNGSFGLWSVGGDDPWLDAYVTDFLTRARGARLRRAADGVICSRSTAFAITSPAQPKPSQERRPRARLCALCAGA